jgi:transcription antitermination protein NusB
VNDLPVKDSVGAKLNASANANMDANAAAKKRAPPKLARRRSRELAMQGLYRWLLAGGEPSAVVEDIRDMDGFEKCDRAHFDALLHGGIEQAAALDAVLARHVDRKTTLLSPVEHAVLMMGVYELMHCLDIPYRVAINEAVELTKTFGGTDGHKYVNGVLDKCAAELRPNEAKPRRAVVPSVPTSDA